MKTAAQPLASRRVLWASLWLLAQAVLAQAQPEPTIVSTVPANFATGVSPSAPVVITFSEPMDPDLTSVAFYDSTTFSELATSDSWNAANTILTCTPAPPFPANRLI